MLLIPNLCQYLATNCNLGYFFHFNLVNKNVPSKKNKIVGVEQQK